VTLTKVSPGQPLRLSADAFNAFVDAAAAHQAGRLGQTSPGGNTTAPSGGVILVRNDSGADRERFAVLGLDTPLILPGDNLAAFQERVAFRCVVPTVDAHARRIAVLQEPIPVGGIGRALVHGVTPALVAMAAEDDALAVVVEGSPRLQSAAEQAGAPADGAPGGDEHAPTDVIAAARILWAEPGTGDRWAILQLPAGGGAGSTGGGAPNLVLSVTAPAHPWFLGDVLAWSGTAWQLADAGAVGASDLLGVVGAIPDANTALVVLWGIVCLDGLEPHTDYWLDPAVPGGLTTTKPDTAPRLVLHHAQERLCVVRAGTGGGAGTDRFADLTDVDLHTAPPTDGQAPLWNAPAQRWRPGGVIRADQPQESHHVLAGPTAEPAAPPTFRLLGWDDLPLVTGPAVLAVGQGGAPSAVAPLLADTDDRALVRVAGRLQWLTIGTALIADNAVTTAKIAAAAITAAQIADGEVSTRHLGENSVTDAKIAGVSWPKITGAPETATRWPTWFEVSGKPALFPPTPHGHVLSGAITGTLDATVIAPGAVGAAAIAPGAVGTAAIANGAVGAAQLAAGSVSTAALADGAVTNAKLARDFLRIANVDYHLGDTVPGLFSNPMTAPGDLIVGGTGGAPTRLPGNPGGTLQVLSSKSGVTAFIAFTLASLEDVAVASPADNDVLTYDAAAGRWRNRVLSALPAGADVAGRVLASGQGSPPAAGWTATLQLGTAAAGGGTLAVQPTATSSFSILADGTLRHVVGLALTVEVAPSGQVQLRFAGGHTVTIAPGDLAPGGGAHDVRLREMSVCTAPGVFRKRLFLCSEAY
jgi:hypothetical protein